MYGLSKDGFKRKRYLDVEEDLFIRARDLYGEDVDLSVRSPIGIFLRVVAWSLALLWETAENVYHQSHLSEAEGVSLDYVAEKADIYRFPALKAHGEVTITGTPGKKIYKGFKISTANKVIFKTDTESTIRSDGTARVKVTCMDTGEKGNVHEGEINTIVNPDVDITGVKNEKAYNNGRDIETDDELRNRYKLSFIGNGKATINAITSRLRKIPTLKACKVYENDTMEEKDGMKPKSIEAVVHGGGDEEIAEAILDSKAAGIATSGTTTVKVKDNIEIEHDISFSRAEECIIPIFVRIVYNENVTDTDAVGERIKERLIEEVSKLTIGETVRAAPLLIAIMEDRAIYNADLAFMSLVNQRISYTVGRNEIPIATKEKITIKID